jgi:uncharacterized YccA/Bax inhibitor family protein
MVGYLAPTYAILEGLFLGGISLFFAGMYNGIVLQAVGITISVAGSLLFLYKTGMVVVDQQFRTAITTATMAIFCGIPYFYGIVFLWHNYSLHTSRWRYRHFV